jgi:queuine/archaeosine tRNA-ribosyltransferase
MEDLKHQNRKGKCNACEKMYRFTIDHLERQNKLLIEMLRDKHLAQKMEMVIPEGVSLICDKKHVSK